MTIKGQMGGKKGIALRCEGDVEVIDKKGNSRVRVSEMEVYNELSMLIKECHRGQCREEYIAGNVACNLKQSKVDSLTTPWELEKRTATGHAMSAQGQVLYKLLVHWKNGW